MCDSIVAAAAETAAGTALFAKNSDRKPGERQPFRQFAAAHHPPAARLRCTHIEIAQAAQTWRTMGHAPAWVWGFEHGVNEHAVAIGNQTVFSNEPLEENAGLIGMDLVRLGLERARDAREALDVITALLEAHGQGGAALAPGGPGYHNSFLIADPASSWVLETSNRRWAARRVGSGSCSNHYSLRDDWEITSPDLGAFARASGWWPDARRLDVAAAFRNPHVPAQISSGRHRRTLEWVARERGRHDRRGLERLLRDHDDGRDGESGWSAGDAKPSDERFFTVCAHSAPVHETTASLVAPLPSQREAPWPVWISFAAPCSGIFLPVYVDGVLPDRLAQEDETGAWQTFARLQAAVARDPARRAPRVRAAFAALEARIEQEREQGERDAREATDRDAAERIVSAFMDRMVHAALQRADELTASLAS